MFIPFAEAVPALDMLEDEHATRGQLVNVIGVRVVNVDGEQVTIFVTSLDEKALHGNGRLADELEFLDA